MCVQAFVLGGGGCVPALALSSKTSGASEGRAVELHSKARMPTSPPEKMYCPMSWATSSKISSARATGMSIFLQGGEPVHVAQSSRGLQGRRTTRYEYGAARTSAVD